MAKISNKELHDCVVKMMDLEEKLLMEEMKDAQPHVFSNEFERKMQEVMRVQARVNKRSDLVRYLATAAVVILMIFGLLFIGNEDLRASEFKINILEWFEEFFVVENDSNAGKTDPTDILFDESQIGYIPEGYEKVAEEVLFSEVGYRYQNKLGDYFDIWIYRDGNYSGVDNDQTKHDIGVSVRGIEYRYVYKELDGEYIITWVDINEKFYLLTSTMEFCEILRVMDSISY